MRVWALLSWYEERPEWLREMVASVVPLVDGVVAVDGPYPLTAHDSAVSVGEQYDALADVCAANGLELHIRCPGALSEVDKRAFMFEEALAVAEPMRDWFLIVDGDMFMGSASEPTEARRQLGRTDCHVAEVTFHNLDPEIDGNPKVRPFRSLFRAIPGLTVDGMHSLYTVPNFEGERLFMWQPIGRHEPVPALDLTQHVHLFHRPHERDPGRQATRQNYYDRRPTEQVPDYVEE